MHPLQEEKLNKLKQEEMELNEKARKQYADISKAISNNEPFATILGLVTDRSLTMHSLGYCQAEITYTKYPLKYEN